MTGLGDIDDVRRVLARVFVVLAVLAWLFTAAAYVSEVAA